MKRTTFSVFPLFAAGVCLMVLVLGTDAKIHHPKFKDAEGATLPNRYIIRFADKEATSAGNTLVQSFKKQFKGATIAVKHDYKHSLFNGISVTIDAEDAKVQESAIKTILDQTNVNAVYPVKMYKRPLVKAKKSDPPSILPHAMTQVDQVHSKLKNKGKGILVGILDTGVDYNHPALGGGFGKGFKVVQGHDLVGDDYTGANTPVPDSDPLDNCGAASGASGHGTHVSGIIAGDYAKTNFTGVAPDANLAMYRVFGCTGEVSGDVIIQALLMAYDGNVDVINLSLGADDAWSESSDAENEVVNKIAAKGVSVVISAGNDGAMGAFTLGQPSTAVNAFSIASIDNAYYTSESFNATGVDHTILYTPAGNSDGLKSGAIAVASKIDNPTQDGCSADLISSEVSGKIALVKRGTCTFDEKVANLASAGAVGVVIYNNVDGAFAASVTDNEIPSVSVALSDGNALVAAIKSQDVTITVDKTPVIASIDTAGTVSSFSSTGASAELNFKPNVAGVGGTVYSTLPEYLGGWGVMSGTSMAAPYVAGSIALYRNAHKNKGTTQYINEQFQNYASARNVYGSTQIDNPIRQGAGLVQVYDAITQNTHISPAQISFNDTSSSKYKKQTITVTNSGSQTITYELYNNVSIGISPYDRKNTGYTFLEPVSTASAPAKLKFSSKKFKLGAGKSKKITITVTPPKTNPLDHIFYGGFIQLKSQQQSAAKDIHVPYFGVVGTQSDLPISDEGFPTILDNSSNEYLSNDTFIYDRSKNSTEPTVYIRLLTPTAKIKAELLDAKKKVIGEAFTGLIYLGRNFLTSAQYTGLPWDGTYVPTGFGASAVPIPAVAGDYYFRFSSLKLMADPKKSKSWEVWNSGKIVVKN